MGRSAPFGAAPCQRGIGFLELLVVVVLTAFLLGVSIPAFWNFYRRHEVQTTTESIRILVHFTRLKTLKEKVSHRILFHDENAATPNRFELQVDEGGGFITLPHHGHSLPEGVRILGSGSTDSMDILSVGTRGTCNSGRVFVQGQGGALLQVVSIQPTCHTRVL